ncbi:MAG: universal stress protein [Halobacteriales archaeon]|nr:universal stress protein [Halobacteriales archaeon]
MTDPTPTDDGDGSLPGSDLNIREPPVILLPVRVMEGQTVAAPLVEFLAPAEIVILGYHVLPEQTPVEQASMQFEDRAQEAVADIAETFRAAGRDPDTRIVFTHNRDQTVNRVATEVGATAILLPNPTGPIETVLVPLRGAIDTNRLADLVATLVGAEQGEVTLWGLSPEDSPFDPDQAVTQAADRLRNRGLSDAQITTDTAAGGTVRDIIDRSDDYDIVVMGAGGTSLLSLLFGEDSERVAEGAVAPVLVVRGMASDTDA